MESPSWVQLESYYNMIGWFPCIAASSTPIRVVIKEVRYIHELSLTLEHSTPVSSPAAPSLTSPRALRSWVLQGSSTSECVVEYFECFEHPTECFRVSCRVLRIVSQVLPIASKLWGDQAQKSFFIWCVMNSRSIWSIPQALGWITKSDWGSIQYSSLKNKPSMTRVPQPPELWI